MIHLRQLYKPIQPTVQQSAEHVQYIEFLPGETLLPYIYCYWELKTMQPLEQAFDYKVVADGCIDIFFELNDPQENFVMGFCKKYTSFSLGNAFHYVGVRFLPTMFPQLFDVNASGLSNRSERLKLVVPAVSDFITSSFSRDHDTAAITQLLDDYFLQHIKTINFDFDNRLYEALDIILKKSGVVNIETDFNIGISQRQLRRLFDFYIGTTIKTFSQVVRFQTVLNANPTVQSLRADKSFFDAGYFDQAHFIKAFKNFYGITPSKAFAR